MRIYLMQHGRPTAKEENPEKPLSVEGRQDVERAAGIGPKYPHGALEIHSMG